MTPATATYTEEIIPVAGADFQVLKAGSGPPLIILHDEMGQHAWLRYQQALSEYFEVSVPSHPGYGKSTQLDWIMTMRDMANWYLQAFDDLGIREANVIGLSLGGWLAATIAAFCPHHFKKMVLVGAAGIKPPEGEIFDMFMETASDYIKLTVADPFATVEFRTICPDTPSPELAEAWEVAREQSVRLSWRPYMHDPALPHLLGRAASIPTLLVWGAQDAIVPVSAGRAYKEAIPGSELVVVEGSGHRPEIEAPDEFLKLVLDFFKDS